MKEQLLSFETAKLAKEKGFDIPCLQAYRVWRENIRKTDINPLEEIGIEYEAFMGGASADIKYYYQSKEYTVAPTQSLLQKWLRKKYDINVYCVCRVGQYKFWIDKISIAQESTTYEKALEKGLQEALKQITI